MRLRQHLRLQDFVELLAGEQLFGKDQIVNALTADERLLRDLGRIGITDVGVEGGDDSDRSLDAAAQMLAVAEACTLAVAEGVDLGVVYEVLTHSTGDCTAIRTRIPFEGARPDAPASNGWKPGFMTELMAKDLGIVERESARVGVSCGATAAVRPVLDAAIAAGFGREDFSAIGKVVRARSGLLAAEP